MNIRNAMMAAASSIRKDPHMFSFSSIFNPDPECGTPGCALGWINHHLGTAVNNGLSNSTTLDMRGFSFKPMLGACLGIGDLEFYMRMDKLCGGAQWRDTAELCAAGLETYADTYYPVIVPVLVHTGIPSKTLVLFEEEAPQLQHAVS